MTTIRQRKTDEARHVHHRQNITRPVALLPTIPTSLEEVAV